MSKDPAFLLYYKDLDADTSSWEADALGWYMRLLCCQAENGFIPENLEEIAQVARVRFSEYEIFCDRWRTRLASKFVSLSEGKVYNKKLARVMQDRKLHAQKKSILASFANILKYGDYTDAQVNKIKKAFDYKDFTEHTSLEKRKKLIKEWVDSILAKRLAKRSHIEDVNANEDVIKDINTISDRKEKFHELISEFVGKYDSALLLDFFEYWTEYGPQDRKMRFEKQTSFDVSKRLKRWLKNDKAYHPEKYKDQDFDKSKIALAEEQSDL